MKKLITIVSAIFMLSGCGIPKFDMPLDNYHQVLLKRKTDKVIKRISIQADPIFQYESASNDFSIVWFHNNNHLVCYYIRPYSVKKYSTVTTNSLVIEKDNLSNYFDNFITKEGLPCFESVLDGEWIILYFKDDEPLSSCINTDCLLNSSFEENSFPYKLQSDFLILQSLIRY